MDRKIEIDKLSEEMFQDVMLAVNTDILQIAREAQNKINELLFRFNIRCDLSINYSVIVSDSTATMVESLPSEVDSFKEEEILKETKVTPTKKKRTKKAKSEK